MQYGKEYENDTIEGFWQFVHFSDEKYVNLGQQRRKRVFREQSIAYEFENIQKMLPF